jgi:type III secretory pathway component EscV
MILKLEDVKRYREMEFNVMVTKETVYSECARDIIKNLCETAEYLYGIVLETQELKLIRDILYGVSAGQRNLKDKLKKEVSKLLRKDLKEAANYADTMAFIVDSKLREIEKLIDRIEEILSKECDE